MPEFQSRNSGFSKQKNNTLSMIGFLFLAILSGIWGVRCDYDKVSHDTGVVIYGTISDSATGLPLEAWVSFDSVLDTILGLFEFADSTGYYRIPNLSTGGNIYSGMEGYLTQMKNFQVVGGDSTNIKFSLAPW